mmetsp:Transcript_28989/g.33161  ORF Transcript_28989/g.33161 Transcript_28989/m.33161 type:complete len:407 (-) Transcript_28989:264-1484(-)|eukprot:CAMPEP_0114993038 /NCGR_PEP_ID=MMETSP0216-20121206/12291_1 /TAXON_ID=223996 /ORGANISM="Protocruzia adherens, Strain Boccale" /LENGTH=406 /DNA_ID=CAMNT_0002356603 /DNA_START=102 /DNA_END=1319 /DNA_ORIENTATION=+
MDVPATSVLSGSTTLLGANTSLRSHFQRYFKFGILFIGCVSVLALLLYPSDTTTSSFLSVQWSIPMYRAPTVALANQYGANNGYPTQDATPRLLGDFNGDGIPDIYAFGISGLQISLGSSDFTFNPTPINVGYWDSQAGYTSFNDCPRYIGDFNGDGKSDIWGWKPDPNGGRNAQICEFGLNNGSGFDITPVDCFVNYWNNWNTDQLFPKAIGDINGDGKDDVVLFGISDIYIGISTGTDFVHSTQRLGKYNYGTYWGLTSDNPRFLGDVNGDGKADIVGYGGDGVWVTLSEGTTFGTPSNWDNFGVGAAWPSQWSTPRYLIDFTGDGKADLYGFSADEVASRYSLTNHFSYDAYLSQRYFIHSAGWTNTNIQPKFPARFAGETYAVIIGFGEDNVEISTYDDAGW